MSDSEDEIVPALIGIIAICEDIDSRSRNRNWWVHPYNQVRERENTLKKLISEVKLYPDKFRNYVRMKEETFNYLLSLVETTIEKQNTNYRKSISPEERLFITLRYLATGETFQSLSYQFRCDASTIEIIVIETCKVIWEMLSPIYLPKPDASKWRSISRSFDHLWNFPNCVGAIDGKHIRIKCPPGAGSQFFNYKKYHSIHLQAVADAHGQFICVDVGDLGRNCDSGVFHNSNFGRCLNNNELNLPMKQKLFQDSNVLTPFVFVADEGYPLSINIMRPFPRRNLNSEKRIYNYRLSRARRVVECAFGMLSKKFRVFDTLISISPSKADYIVLAGCALHNMIREKENSLEDVNVEVDAMERREAQREPNDMMPEHARPSNAARMIRNHFVDYFNSSHGSVPWQSQYAI